MALKFRSLLVSASLIFLAACDRLQPAKVCAAETTLDMVRQLTIRELWRSRANFGVERYEQAFADVIHFDLITFQGRDDRTGTVNCQLTVSGQQTNAQVTILYSRQPQADGKDFVYSIEMPGVASDWWPISAEINERYSELETPRFVPQPDDVASPASADTQEPPLSEALSPDSPMTAPAPSVAASPKVTEPTYPPPAPPAPPRPPSQGLVIPFPPGFAVEVGEFETSELGIAHANGMLNQFGDFSAGPRIWAGPEEHGMRRIFIATNSAGAALALCGEIRRGGHWCQVR